MEWSTAYTALISLMTNVVHGVDSVACPDCSSLFCFSASGASVVAIDNKIEKAMVSTCFSNMI